MIEQQGRVVGLEGTTAIIEIGPGSGCAACDAGKGCGAGVFAQLLGRKTTQLELENTIKANPGQAVMVGISETLFLQLLMKMYLLPLVSGLIGAGVGRFFAIILDLGSMATDVMTLTVAIFFVALVFWRIRMASPKWSARVDLRMMCLADDADSSNKCDRKLNIDNVF